MKIKLSDLFSAIKSGIFGSGYIFLSIILERALFFFLFVFMARKLSTEEYGQIVFIFSTANILASFFEFGLPVYFQRESAVASGTLKNELNSALLFKLFSFPFYIVLLLFYLFAYSAVTVSSVIIIGTTIFLFGINVLLNSILYGRHFYRSSFYGIILSRIIVIIFMILYMFQNLNAEFILSGFFISGMVHFTVLNRILNKNGFRFNLKYEFSALKSILKSSGIIYTGYICIWLYDKIDIIFLEEYLNYKAVALYAAAYSVYKLPQILSGIILVPLFSGLSKDYSVSQKLNRNKVMFAFAVLISVSLIISIITSTFSSEILTIVYGNNYAQAGAYLKYLLIAVPGLIMNNLTGIISNTIRKEMYSFSGVAAGAIVNILLCLILIPRWGISGAIAATVFTEYSVLGVQAFLIGRLNKEKIIFV